MTESREHSDKLYDLSSLEELSGGNNDFIRQMIILFLEQAAATIAGMENAIAEKGISQIKSLTHQLKPNIEIFCINNLGDWIKEIEHMAENNPGSPLLEDKIRQCNALLRQVMDQLKNHYG
jgi:HPt (histidine-containing phosphotransfer) domain-containing protein